jgi:peptidyl-prolyl cis-trans isomerase C
VKSEFGYHVIEVQDKRNRPAATYEVAKPFLASQLQNAVLEEVLQKWRAAENVEIFDINGDAFAPAAGE